MNQKIEKLAIDALISLAVLCLIVVLTLNYVKDNQIKEQSNYVIETVGNINFRSNRYYTDEIHKTDSAVKFYNLKTKKVMTIPLEQIRRIEEQ